MFICDISVLNRYGKQRLDELLSELFMDWHMLVALLVVEQAPGISQARLSIFLQTDKANISKILKSMEQRGLIRRVADPADLRNKICYATSEGQMLAPQLWKILDLWENECFQDIDKKDLEVFKRVSNTICQNLMKGLEM